MRISRHSRRLNLVPVPLNRRIRDLLRLELHLTLGHLLRLWLGRGDKLGLVCYYRQLGLGDNLVRQARGLGDDVFGRLGDLMLRHSMIEAQGRLPTGCGCGAGLAA